MKKFRYRVVYLGAAAKEDEELLNSLGEDGWELVAVTDIESGDIEDEVVGFSYCAAYLKMEIP